MVRPVQPDLFAGLETKGSPAGSDLQGLTASEMLLPPYRPDLDDVRRRLNRILGEARAAQTLPWDSERLSIYRAIVPHMTTWLPEEEGAQLRFELETELARLDAAAQGTTFDIHLMGRALHSNHAASKSAAVACKDGAPAEETQGEDLSTAGE